MMKKSLFFLIFVLMFGLSVAWAQQGKRHDPNPQKDSGVQQGYDEHQEWYKKKQKEQKQNSGKDKNTPIITKPLTPRTGDYYHLDGSTDTKSD